MVQVNCPICNQLLLVEAREESSAWKCPACQTGLVVDKCVIGEQKCVVTPIPNLATNTAIQEQAASVPKKPRKLLDVDPPDLTISELGAGFAKFTDMTPVTRPPMLFAYGFMGLTFFSVRNYDVETDTYVVSHCFFIFVVPVFFLGAYRVATAGKKGYRVIGKVPISNGAIVWNFVMSILLIYIILYFARGGR